MSTEATRRPGHAQFGWAATDTSRQEPPPRPRHGVHWHRRLHAAEWAAETAAARYRYLKAATAAQEEAAASREHLRAWQRLLLCVVVGGVLVGLLMMWLFAAAYLGPVAILAVPAAILPGTLLVLLWQRYRADRRHSRRPLVADLVQATREMHDAELALARVREEMRNR